MQLMWFRNDLRSIDNMALQEALERGGPLVVLYVHCSGQMDKQGIGSHKQWFHLRHVQSLFEKLQDRAVCLYREVPLFDDIPTVFESILDHLASEIGKIESVYFTREVGIWEQQRDQAVSKLCSERGVSVFAINDDSILPPGSVRQSDGSPYKVFTPYKKAWYQVFETTVLASYDALPKCQKLIDANFDENHQALEALIDKHSKALGADVVDFWPIGEAQAARRLDAFIEERLSKYKDQRDFPALDGTSALSPYLASGVVSARALFSTAQQLPSNAGRDTWLSELIWRDFYRQVMRRFEQVSKNRCFNSTYDSLTWRSSESDLKAWRNGTTGVPLVDAGMRQLRSTGWMHNRVRMVVAMFLSKNLFLDWRLGERHFMHYLLDGDFASNNGGWQWSASVGTDAAPYFRIFNPLTQAERFDPQCNYIRRFIPELEGVADRAILKADQSVLPDAGYPRLIVDVKESRKRAIEHFKQFNSSSQ